jgi:hypothetical protein
MNNTRKLNKTLLALAIGTVTHSAYAATTDSKEDTIVVQAAPASDFKPGGDRLVPAFLDGQVANGGRMGMLGQQNAMDVPFNIISYTAKLVEDQQARTVGDVVSNDAGVQPLQGYGNYAESFRIRGLKFDGDDMTFGGLSGVLPRQVVDAQMVDRIEIFKGSNALMNGAASSGVGGMINLEPKHAGDTPQVKLGMDYTSDAQIGTTVDAGRRFGESDQFGARVNLVHREGDTAIDNDRRRTTLASVGLDYKGDKFRTSVDMGYQKKTFHGGETGLNIMYVDFVPSLPKNDHSYSQKWAWSDVENEFGMWRSEYDINDSWTAYTGLGAQHAHELGLYSAPRLQDESGNATASRLDTNRISDTMSGMAGIRGNFDTGFVSHKVNVGYSAQTKEEKIAWKMSKLADNPLVDDLCTLGTKEPYRMFTSRAEYRLMLREDNADLRLTEMGRELGLVDDERWARFNQKLERIETERQRLKSTWVNPLSESAAEVNTHLTAPLSREASAEDLLRRPEMTYAELVQMTPFAPGLADAEAAEQVEIQVKYEGYIARQQDEIEKQQRNENTLLPAVLDYRQVTGLSNEVIAKLNDHKPVSIGQASRISGVTPAAISILLVWLKKQGMLRRSA